MVKLGMSKRLMARRAAVVEGMEAIPEMTPADAAKYLAARPGRIVVAKPNDGTEGDGLQLFRRADNLSTTGTRLYEGGHVLQPFLAGDEFSINMVWHGGRASVYPPVSKGAVDAQATHPIFRARTCPAGLRRDPCWPGLMESCFRYLEPFKPEGPVELEFIRRSDRFFLLDVNPRLSATLRLNAVASETNPLTDLIAAACGRGELGGAVRDRQHALEWPLLHGIEPDVRDELTGRAYVWISTRVTLAAPDVATLAARATEVRATLQARS
jgi:predicted ATP-grasp superfamily ATP-dependent carboligase